MDLPPHQRRPAHRLHNEVATSDPSQPKTIEQAPLTASNNTVIIRRGDTLWQISRRVYGLGVRYTTIYIANEDQITNPDRILPGQIFGVPKDALPNAEELHRRRLSGQHLSDSLIRLPLPLPGEMPLQRALTCIPIAPQRARARDGAALPARCRP